MHFDVSAFTDKGTVRKRNEDRILVNGKVLSEGRIDLTDLALINCFVADGVGGEKAGDIAAEFVLEGLSEYFKCTSFPDEAELIGFMERLNAEMIEKSQENESCASMATTLTGMLYGEGIFCFLNAGDSPVYYLRHNMLMKISHDHVLDPNAGNSPITSYFGGGSVNLNVEFYTFIREVIPGDIYLICSDGLFKAVDQNTLKSILMEKASISVITDKIKDEALFRGSPDNISLILIHAK